MPATNEEWAAVKELILNTVKRRESRRALVSGIGELLGHPVPLEPIADAAEEGITRKPGRPRKDPGAAKTVHRRRGVGLPHEDDPDHVVAPEAGAGAGAPKSRRKRLIRRIDFDVLETMVLRGIAAEHNS